MNAKITKLWNLTRMRHAIQCHGCFDLLHVGHIRYLQWAKSLMPSAPLIVTLTSDEHFPKYKGDWRPAFNEQIRAECLAALEVVDHVAIVHEPTGVGAINVLHPAIYAKGWEAKGVIPDEVAAVESHGGRVEYMEKESEKGQIYSSGMILSGELMRQRTMKAAA